MEEYIVKVYENGRVDWLNKKGQPHRNGGLPAVEFGKHQEYWVNGRLHRDVGPAIILESGNVQYWKNGKEITKGEFENYNNKVIEIDGKKYKLVMVGK